MLPPLSGRPIRVEIRRTLEAHHAATSIPRRQIFLDAGVLLRPGEFERILIHELFHFVWVRLGNRRRREWERCLVREVAARARGELGWSAESRKRRLTAGDCRNRTRRWRSYACESFCDTAAWMYGSVRRHDEFTLSVFSRRRRRAWFRRHVQSGVGL